MNIAVLASGRGSNFQAIVRNVKHNHLQATITCLISDNPDAYALQIAKDNGIEALYFDPKQLNDKDHYNQFIADELLKRSVQLVVLAGYMRIVRKPLLNAFPNAIINIHPTLLPSFPGAHGHRDAIAYGVKYSGCTVHFVDEGMDTGPIIMQSVIPVDDKDTEESLAKKILPLEHMLLSEAIRLFISDRLKINGRKVIIN